MLHTACTVWIITGTSWKTHEQGFPTFPHKSTASAILEAQRFNAKYAMMIVHSFSPEHKWFSDYQDFLDLFGAASKINELVELPQSEGKQIFTGWAVGQQKGG